MKLLNRFVLVHLLCFIIHPVFADTTDEDYSQETSANTQDLVTYLVNLGSYLGYNIKVDPTSSQAISQYLISPDSTQLAETLVYSTLFGAIPIAVAAGGSTFQFVSSSTTGAGGINSQANATFLKQNYSAPSTNGSTITVNALLDQQTYQADPVSQAVYNILSTPDVSYCTNGNGSIANPCTALSPYLYQNQVMSNIIGPLPDSKTYYTYSYNQALIGQLNSNSLIAPLYFTTDGSNQQASTGSSTTNSTPTGLTAQNQAQQAANFIRYVSGSVTPLTLPTLTDYNSLYSQSLTATDPVAQSKAAATLNSFFTNLRVYAAQSSVGLGNLYYILSRRLPQSTSGSSSDSTTSGSTSSTSSQAVSEFNMATWRLFAPSSSGSTNTQQWIQGINNASPATVQKEIAVLLAEINYQMYLDRQIQERILMTNSVLLMQNTKANQPSSDFSNQ